MKDWKDELKDSLFSGEKLTDFVGVNIEHLRSGRIITISESGEICFVDGGVFDDDDSDALLSVREWLI